METKSELIKDALSLLEKGKTGGFYSNASPVAERRSAICNEATALMLLALYQQNEEIIAQNKAMLDQSITTIMFLQRIAEGIE